MLILISATSILLMPTKFEHMSMTHTSLSHVLVETAECLQVTVEEVKGDVRGLPEHGLDGVEELTGEEVHVQPGGPLGCIAAEESGTSRNKTKSLHL